jgi:PBP1b-binding outer membrane lipoprotein LpoB
MRTTSSITTVLAAGVLLLSGCSSNTNPDNGVETDSATPSNSSTSSATSTAGTSAGSTATGTSAASTSP